MAKLDSAPVYPVLRQSPAIILVKWGLALLALCVVGALAYVLVLRNNDSAPKKDTPAVPHADSAPPVDKNQAPAIEKKIAKPKSEKAKSGTAKSGTANTDASSSGATTSDKAKTSVPRVEMPIIDEPKTAGPKAAAPKTAAPKAAAPKTAAPTEVPRVEL